MNWIDYLKFCSHLWRYCYCRVRCVYWVDNDSDGVFLQCWVEKVGLVLNSMRFRYWRMLVMHSNTFSLSSIATFLISLAILVPSKSVLFIVTCFFVTPLSNSVGGSYVVCIDLLFLILHHGLFSCR